MLIEILNKNYQNIFFIIGSVFLVSFFIQIIYYLIYIKALRVKNNRKLITEPASIVICARNEEENLRENLPKILKQNYDNYEVIVVNDSSTDDSLNVLAEFKKEYSNFRYTNIDEI